MEPAPDAGDTKDFRFEKLSELTAWSPDKEREFSSVVRGLTVTNKYGYVVCVCEKGFSVLSSQNFGPAFSPPAESASRSLEQCGSFSVSINWQPVLVAFSSSGLTLAVCVMREDVPVVFFYDTRAFARRDPETQPFHTVVMSTQTGNTVADFAWIPTEEDIFVVILRDGALGLFEIKDGPATVVSTLGKDTAAVSVSWSPKGKQFVVGRPDGSLVQYKPDLTIARNIAGPKGPQTYVCQKVVWLSTFVFAVSYMKAGDTQPTMVIVHAPKTGEPIFTDFGDVSAGFTDQQRLPFYHLWPILEWKILLAASNTGPEVAVLSCQSDDESTGWLHMVLEETGRAEMPFVDSEEAYPIGLAVLTCIQNPVLVVLTTLGLVVSFRVVNQLKIKGVADNNSICSSPQNIIGIPGERPQLSPQRAPPKPTVPSIPIPAGFGMAATPTQSPLQQSTNKSSVNVLSSLTGGSTQPSSLFGPSTAKSTPTVSPFAQPLFGADFKSDFSSTATSQLNTSLPLSGSNFGPQGFFNTSKTAVAGAEATGQLSSGAAARAQPKSAITAQSPSMVLTTVISKSFDSSSNSEASSANAPAGPMKIPSKALLEFMRYVGKHGRQISQLKVASDPPDELSVRMDAIAEVLEKLTAFYDDAALGLNKKELVLEERLHVVEEAMLVVERCSDPQFRDCLKLIPLDPMRRRQFEDLEDRLVFMQNKLKSLERGVDLELDIFEAGKNTSDAGNHKHATRKLLKDLEEVTLKLQKRAHQLGKEVRRLGLKGHFRPNQSYQRDVSLSPAELVSRLYPSLAPEQPAKISSDVLNKLRHNLKTQPPRLTKHEIVLFQRGRPEASSTKGPSTSRTTVQSSPSSSSLKAAEAEKSFTALWNMKICAPDRSMLESPEKFSHVSVQPTDSIRQTASDQRPASLVDKEKKPAVSLSSFISPTTPLKTTAKPSLFSGDASDFAAAPSKLPGSIEMSASPKQLSGPSSSSLSATTKPSLSTEGSTNSSTTETQTKSPFGGFGLVAKSESKLVPSGGTSVMSQSQQVKPFGSPSFGSGLSFGLPASSSVSTGSGPLKTSGVETSIPSSVSPKAESLTVAAKGSAASSDVSKPVSGFNGGTGSFSVLLPITSVHSLGSLLGAPPADIPASTLTLSTGSDQSLAKSPFGNFGSGLASSLTTSPSTESKILGSGDVSSNTPTISASSTPKPTFGGFGFAVPPTSESTKVPSMNVSSLSSPLAAAEPQTLSSNFSGFGLGGGGFGSSPSPSGGFGSTTAPSSGFGSTTTPSSGFGSTAVPSSGFGSTTTPSSGFGSTAVPSSGFGSTTTPSSGFGSTTTPSSRFGSTAVPSSGFGSSSAFGQSSASGGFGQSTGGGFGQTAAAPTVFGSPSAFGGSAFGSAQQATVQPAPPLSSFGGFKLGASNPTGSPFSSGFGSAPAFGSSSAFGQPAAFGSPNAFSSPQQSVQQPGGSFIWGSPGGFAAYSQQPNVSFGTVAAQSGSPAPGFGSQPQQQGGFGSQPQQQQGGFGSVPQQQGGFGSVPQQQQVAGFGFGGGQSTPAPAQTNTFMQYR